METNMARRSAMQKVAPGWKMFSLAVTSLAALLVVGVWTKQTAPVSPPTTVGVAVPAEGAAISPTEIMIRRGRELPVAEPVDPF
jgi:hypothetical protein